MIDTHCHIDLFSDPLAVANEAEKAGIFTVAVTYLPSHYKLAVEHLKGFKFVRPALGLHPMVARQHKAEHSIFSALADSAPLIGEIGLDFSQHGRATRLMQEESFHLALSSLKEKKFITLHSRGAESEVLQRLRNHSISHAVFHYFSGSRAQLFRLIDEGHSLSINTAMIGYAKWSEFAAVIPPDRILVESDGPFVKHNRKPVRPSDLGGIYEWLAVKWSKPIEETREQVTSNFLRLCPSSAFNTPEN